MHDLLAPEDFIENRPYDELAVGDSASIVRTLGARDIELFAVVSGDVNPAHLDPAYAAHDMFHRVIAHGMWGGALISAVLGTRLPGPGTIYVRQDLQFRAPVGLGDRITARVVVTEKRPHRRVVLACSCTNQDGVEVIGGTAEVQAPVEKFRAPRIVLPEVRMARHDGFAPLIALARQLGAVPAAVVWPVDAEALDVVAAAAREGLILPILIGPAAQIRAAATFAGLDIDALRIEDVGLPQAAMAAGLALVGRGEARLLVLGNQAGEAFLESLRTGTGPLVTGRAASHVHVAAVPEHPRLLLVSDTAVHIAPGLETKRDIVQSAIDLAHMLGIEQPRVALLAAQENISRSLPSTLHAAALCKMADRGQITGGVLDGPLTFEAAVSPAAAAARGMNSDVAGQADILLVPDFEAGNMLVKQLGFMADADLAGVVLGLQVPVVLTAEGVRSAAASCAMARLVCGEG